MKLRNKKTGEVDDFIFEVITDRIDLYRRVGSSDTKNIWHYNSIAELNEEWEDYEEPKKHYEILSIGAVMEREDAEDEICRNQGQREIGNYFATREEAEQAVEKLRAWKRLKDKGMKLRLDGGTNCIAYKFDQRMLEEAELVEVIKDLNLLFGGEK